jgi:hypothetical protein
MEGRAILTDDAMKVARNEDRAATNKAERRDLLLPISAVLSNAGPPSS